MAIEILIAATACFLLSLRGCGPYYLNLSPASDSGGTVSIATDHTRIRTTESLHITVTNHLSMPIYALANGASCSILHAETLSDGTWDGDTLSGAFGSCEDTCPGGPVRTPLPSSPPTRVEIAPGHSMSATIHPDIFNPSVPPAIYRFVLVYTTDNAIPSSDLVYGTQPSGASEIAVAASAPLHIDDTTDSERYRPISCV